MSGGTGTANASYSGCNVLVTGADGFIGSHLTERLTGLDANVTALSLYNAFDTLGWLDDLPAATRRRVTLVRGDVRDPGFVRRIMAGQEIVFHLAALVAIPHSYAAPQAYVDTNVTGTLNVLEAALMQSVRRIVHTSTSEVYGTAINVAITEEHPLHCQSPYSASKIGADMLAESFARSFDLPVVILRPFNIFGPRQSERAVIPTVVRQALDAAVPAIEVGDLIPARDFTYVDDIVSAFLDIGVAAEIEFGRPYNAGSGKSVTMGEVIDRVRRLTGCRKPLIERAARARPPQSEVRELLADSSSLSRATGWSPRIDFDEGLSRMIGWWCGRHPRGRVRSEICYAT